MIHTDNRPIKILSLADQSRLYIGLLWPHRHTRGQMVRNLIRAHLGLIRKGRDVLKGVAT